MSDSVRPHRRQPTRLPRPWDSPGKNTGVGCHFLLQCMKVKTQSEVAQSCPTLSDPMDCSPPGSSVHGSFQARGLEWVASAFVSEDGVQEDLLNGILQRMLSATVYKASRTITEKEQVAKNTGPFLHKCSCKCGRLVTALEKAMAPHSSTLAWKIPWMEEPGGLQSMGSLGIGHD